MIYNAPHKRGFFHHFSCLSKSTFPSAKFINSFKLIFRGFPYSKISVTIFGNK